MKAPLPQAAELSGKEPASPSGDYFCGRKREKCFCVDYINHSFTNYINTIYYLYEKKKTSANSLQHQRLLCKIIIKFCFPVLRNIWVRNT